jgi:regulator of sigma E protease
VLLREPAAAGRIDIGLGFAQRIFRSPRLGLPAALVTGVQRTGEIVGMSVSGLRQLVRMRDRKLDEVVAGPIRITRMVGEAAVFGFRLGVGEGLVAFFQFVALLSIAIAIMNLLPLPALDGGLIVISAAEGISRRRPGPRLLWRFQIIGAIVVFGLIFLAVASDILFFVGRSR